MDVVTSINGVLIRLTDERWEHIVSRHDDVRKHYDAVLDTVGNPDLILRGYHGSLIAIRVYGRRHYLAVVYKEVTSDDGFIITAYFTSQVERGKTIWRKL